MLPSAHRALRDGAIPAALLAALCCWSATAPADGASPEAAKSLDTIVVTTKKVPEVVPDEVVKTRVGTALSSGKEFPA